jgi:hypothetical protein
MTFTNRGQSAVEVPTPIPQSNRYRFFDFGFRIYDPETQLLIQEGRGGQAMPPKFGDPPMELAPGESVTSFWIVFFPSLSEFNSVFWTPRRGGGTVTLRSVFLLGEYRELAHLGDPHEVILEARKETEMEVLEKWAKISGEVPAEGPSPADLGIAFGRPLNRAETEEVARHVGGELSDLLRLSLRLEELYAMPPEAEEAACPALVEWLQSQPDIKRQALTQAAQRIAQTYEPKMFVTADALQQAQGNE